MMDETGVLLIVAGAVFLIITGVGFSFLSKWARKRAWEKKRTAWSEKHLLIKPVVDGIAWTSVVQHRPESSVYTKSGSVRVAVSREVARKAEQIKPLIDRDWDEFGSYLQTAGLVDENGTIHDSQVRELESYWIRFQDVRRKQAVQRGDYGRKFTVEGFLLEADARIGSSDFTGVYVLFNVDRQMAYVGQAKRVFARVKQHLDGKGCKRWYQHYLADETMTITLYPLEGSGVSSLDLLEKNLIHEHDAYHRGYNRTRGNG